MMPILTAKKLSRQVQTPDGPLTILDQVDLAIMPGEVVAITGPSGSGKSTLIGLLAGLETPTSGSVCLLGQELSLLTEDQKAALRAGNVGFVFQAFHLIKGLTAVENVELALELADSKDQRQNARHLLEQVGLGARLKHYPAQLSGGEQQRVALARAFAVHPGVLFADEPTGNLDASNSEIVADLFFDLRRRYGSALLLVTHDPALAGRCDRILTLGAGGRLQS
ncbi:MAG: ATP-binding cassette domain-containing protein [Pseudomonadota bacterium]|jgi:putative ABC transport system ATP-binding protein|nr:ATP-binding cassette domain-containing protein [Pseudomonadota bacterium]MED5407668.1 ATP-binding cassette domain-containing protein [Pseudomonadota bacterium]MEE3288409.1 ATP-binding cassette domain-containing protein [Pseudomonadota bacterium]